MSPTYDILVVNDHLLDAHETLIALEQVARTARVLHLESGAEALEYLFSAGSFAGRTPRMPQLVLLSLEMRVANGLCVLELMRAHPLTCKVPVVLLSLEHNARRHRRNDMFDADAYVSKPCNFQRYCAVLDGCVRHWLPSAHDRSARRTVLADPAAFTMAPHRETVLVQTRLTTSGA